jgi:hypothetical protein
LDFGGIPRILEEFLGFWRNSSDFGGIPRILEEFRGIWRNSTDYEGILQDILRISMEFLVIFTEFIWIS